VINIVYSGKEVKNKFMPITKWDPFIRWPRWLEEIEEPSMRGLKIRETDKDIIAEAVVAGVPSKNVDVHIEDGILTIKAEAKEEKKGKDEYKSSSYQYYYTAALSGGAWDKANAEVENGVVVVTIPKAEAARPRKIAVKEKNSA
jgi:HSP20 family protein